MRPHPLRPLLLASAIVFATATMTASAQSPATVQSQGGTLLSVAAQAEARRAPDVATLSTGVVSQAADATAAMRANSVEMDKVMAAIRKAGIAERDIQTSGIQLNPQYRYEDNQPPQVTGYQAGNNVSITVRDIARLGDVLDALVAAGANQINGPTFGIDEPEAVYDEARRAALEKARTRAAMYAESLGLRVLRITSIDEGGGFMQPQPVMAAGARIMAKDAMAAPPVAPGESILSANLTVVFELGH